VTAARNRSAIDGESIAANSRLFAAANHQRAEELHLAFEEPDGVGDRGRSERIRADQAPQDLMSGCAGVIFAGRISKQVDAVAALSELESAL